MEPQQLPTVGRRLANSAGQRLRPHALVLIPRESTPRQEPSSHTHAASNHAVPKAMRALLPSCNRQLPLIASLQGNKYFLKLLYVNSWITIEQREEVPERAEPRETQLEGLGHVEEVKTESEIAREREESEKSPGKRPSLKNETWPDKRNCSSKPREQPQFDENRKLGKGWPRSSV